MDGIKMQKMECVVCGGQLTQDMETGKYTCEYCGQVYKDINNNLYYDLREIVRLRQMREFIKAEELCEELLKGMPQNSELHWQLLLSKFGIVYVQEDSTAKPTLFGCTYSREQTIFEDPHYLAAVEFAEDEENKAYYEKKAEELNVLMEEFFVLMDKEPEYDIFISFKHTMEATTASGEKVTFESDDYKKAREIYEHLKNKYRVFFAPVSIGESKDIIGNKYEPRILKALQTSHALILVGFTEENIKSQWVENEWRRYKYYIDKGIKRKDSLIYVYEKRMVLPAALKDIQWPNVDVFEGGYLSKLDQKVAFVQAEKNKHKKVVKAVKKAETPSAVNNEEKQDEVEGVKTEAQTSKSWWKQLKAGAKVALIFALVLLIAIPTSIITLLGGSGDGPGTGEGGGNGDVGSGETGETVAYSVTLTTQGGMPIANHPVYIHEYEDGAIGEVIDGAYAATDASGKATFNLPENGSYAAKVNLGLPEGYDAESFYPMVSNDLSITLSTGVIPETSLVGVSYGLGSVMRDFTVTGNILVENDKGELEYQESTVTLSELLQEKDAVLINFWFSTCGPCQSEFPLMQQAYEMYSDDLAIIALDPNPEDTPSIIKDYQGQLGLSFNVGQDTIGLGSAFGVTAYPTSIIVDRYGVVAMIEVGSITSQRVFEVVFDHFTGDDYEQKLIVDYEDIVPKEKPDVEMPSSEEFADAFEKDGIGGVDYRNDEEDEYSWPFLIGQIGEGEDAVQCVYPSNAYKEASYAQLLFTVPLNAGEVLAFDYYSSTERGADILYVVVNGKDIYSISGESTEWKTCYAFVAEETADYEVGIVYAKDSSDNVGADTVYLKDLRITTEELIDSETYIYRFAATNPDDFSTYQDYVDIFLGSDGYYHVGSETGPILLADLMSYTRFSEESTVYYMATDLVNDKQISEEDYDRIVEYCNYASNASIYGVSPVTPELKELLWMIVEYYGDPDNENDWQRFCCYYDAYGTDGKQLEDPIKGLAFFSAYDVIESEYGSTEFPNSFTYDRVIMPRGKLGKFTPAVSGTYLITSNTYDELTDTHAECNAWIFVKDDLGERTAWLTYDNVDRFNTTDNNNCYMIAYLEAGVDYYIDIAYYDVYGEGTIKYRVERLGDEGYYRFSLAAPPFFTTLMTGTGEMTGYIISGGIDLELGDDGIWREKRPDGREGSIIYADFTMKTPLFSHTLLEMIDLGGFDFSRTENDQEILNFIALNDGDVEKCDEYLREYWGEDYEEYAEIYMLEEVYDAYLNDGDYHGEGNNYTALAKQFASQIITVGYNETLGEEILEGDERIGCVVVTADLADLLQLLMNKYTFMNGQYPNQTPVENSWAKLCYYTQYFNAATPK